MVYIMIRVHKEPFSAVKVNEVFSFIYFFKVSGVGAKELWATLRSKSRMKLEMEDDMIPVDVKVT